MISFLQENGITIVIVIIIVLCALLAVRKIIKDKKSGGGSCGCNCSDCPKAGSCDAQPDKE